METGVEGVGEAVTGAMLARAVESEAGEDGHTHEAHCLNCGAELTGPFCHLCGQKGHVPRTLVALGHDLSHGVLHFEGKVWRTLPLLALWPGDLTRRYVHGERARFVSPMALFLFSVFLMFAVFTTVGGPFDTNDSSLAAGEARGDLAREAGTLRSRIQMLERERRTLAASGRPTAAIDGQLRTLNAQRQALETTRAIVLAPNTAPEGSTTTLNISDSEIDTGWPLLDHGIEKARDNPSLLIYKLQTNAYKFSWALIPISVPFVWLLFLHRRRYRAFKAYDHVVFVTYSIAFMSLTLVVLSLLRPLGVGDPVSGLVITLVPPIHIYRQLRGAYQLRWYSALWRTAALLVIAMFSITVFFLLLLALGVLG